MRKIERQTQKTNARTEPKLIECVGCSHEHIMNSSGDFSVRKRVCVDEFKTKYVLFTSNWSQQCARCLETRAFVAAQKFMAWHVDYITQNKMQIALDQSKISGFHLNFVRLPAFIVIEMHLVDCSPLLPQLWLTWSSFVAATHWTRLLFMFTCAVHKCVFIMRETDRLCCF